MEELQRQQIKILKEKFWSLNSSERTNLGVCFLKVKLAVNNSDELETVKGFLGGFKISLNTANIDAIVNYLHSEAHTLPEFVALEDSLNSIDVPNLRPLEHGLPPYDPDNVETIKEPMKAMKK